MINQNKMKITIEQYEHKITYEVPHNDVPMDEMLEILERLLKATGYVFSGNLEIVDDSVEESTIQMDNRSYLCAFENDCDGVRCYNCIKIHESKKHENTKE